MQQASGGTASHDQLDESYRRARRDRRAFLRALREHKWQTQHVLLSSAERAPYVAC
jgi:hypothetical protein